MDYRNTQSMELAKAALDNKENGEWWLGDDADFESFLMQSPERVSWEMDRESEFPASWEATEGTGTPLALEHFMDTEHVIDGMVGYFDVLVRTNKEREVRELQSRLLHSHGQPRTGVVGWKYGNMDEEDARAFELRCAPSETVEVRSYLRRLRKYARVSRVVYYVCLAYVERFVARTGLVVNELNAHKLLLAAFVVAIKFCEDRVQTNEYYSRVGGIHAKDMNRLEQLFLQYVGFDLYVDGKELYRVALLVDNYQAMVNMPEGLEYVKELVMEMAEAEAEEEERMSSGSSSSSMSMNSAKGKGGMRHVFEFDEDDYALMKRDALSGSSRVFAVGAEEGEHMMVLEEEESTESVYGSDDEESVVDAEDIEYVEKKGYVSGVEVEDAHGMEEEQEEDRVVEKRGRSRSFREQLLGLFSMG